MCPARPGTTELAAAFRESGAALVPFLLDGVALNPELMQDDGIHANAKGQPRMLDNMWPALKPLLVAPRRPAG